MSESNPVGQGSAEIQPVEESPDEKLHGSGVTGPLTPGAQNPESEEVKQESSPNSE